MQAQRDPRTKRELVDRLMSYDFGGDFRNLGALGVDVLRKADNKVTLRFKESGQEFELTIRKPAPSRHGVDTRAVAAERRVFSGEEPATTEDEWLVSPEPRKRKGIRPEEPRRRK